ncbi:MAG: peptidoglycan DD-metalloendopeptidase family protein [Pseudomonadales bacterium]
MKFLAPLTHVSEQKSGGWPRFHLFGVGCLMFFVLVLLLLVPPSSVEAGRSTELPSGNAQPESVAKLVDAELEKTKLESPKAVKAPKPIQQPEIAAAPKIDWQTITVARGDNLSLVFQRVGLTSNDVLELLNTCPEAKQLVKVYPGHQFAFHIENQKLQQLRHVKSALETQEFSRKGGYFVAQTVFRDAEKRLQYRRAHLEDSLFLAGQNAGLSQNTIMQLANVFGGVIDFVFDPRQGDSFSILYEELYLDGEKISNGKILAAKYVNRGNAMLAYRYEDGDGESGYYSPDGVSMQKAFLRAPLDFARISSPFSLRRVHPIHKKIRAHRGIDYVAPTGTPVYAAGDGRVLRAGYTRGNGNFVVLGHGQKYQTKYLHLSKLFAKRGQSVEKGQIIGHVGATGYATGPHLHYEFLANGVHRNPRTILSKLPKAKSIASSEMARFKQQIAQLQTQLAQHQRAFDLASGDNTGASEGAYTLTQPLVASRKTSASAIAK